MTDSPTVIVGAGGHAKVVAATFLEAGRQIEAILDKDPSRQGAALLGHEILPQSGYSMDGRTAILAIGDNKTRLRLASALRPGAWTSAVHPRAYVHPDAQLGVGTLVCAGAIVQPGAIIGDHVIINTGSIIEHDCVVGDFVHVAPAACLAGGAILEEGAFVGLKAGLLPAVRAGAWSTIGGGACVIEDVPPGATVVGVPARTR